MEALSDSFWWYGREQAADVLLDAIESFREQAVELLLAALEHKEAAVRRFAARLLGRIKDPRAIESLGMTLYDLHHEVGRAAAEALSQFGGDSLEVLAEAALHPEPGIRQNVVAALGKIQDARVTPILLEMIHDSDRSIQMEVVKSLMNLKDNRAVPALREIAASRADREMAALAKQALQSIQ